MRAMIRDAISGARDAMLAVARETGGQPYTDEELLERYRTFHQGRPGAILDFVKREAPPGSDLIEEGVRYEKQMEELAQATGR